MYRLEVPNVFTPNGDEETGYTPFVMYDAEEPERVRDGVARRRDEREAGAPGRVVLGGEDRALAVERVERLGELPGVRRHLVRFEFVGRLLDDRGEPRDDAQQVALLRGREPVDGVGIDGRHRRGCRLERGGLHLHHLDADLVEQPGDVGHLEQHADGADDGRLARDDVVGAERGDVAARRREPVDEGHGGLRLGHLAQGGEQRLGARGGAAGAVDAHDDGAGGLGLGELAQHPRGLAARGDDALDADPRDVVAPRRQPRRVEVGHPPADRHHGEDRREDARDAPEAELAAQAAQGDVELGSQGVRLVVVAPDLALELLAGAVLLPAVERSDLHPGASFPSIRPGRVAGVDFSTEQLRHARHQLPAIAASWPAPNGFSTVLDVGANVEITPSQLVEFAVLGEAFHRAVHAEARPTVGLLNVGQEELKGSQIIRDADALFRQAGLDMDYRGFVEGDDISAGTTNVVVTDGFTGNVALKTAEGTARLVGGWLRETLTGSFTGKLAGALLQLGALKGLKAKMDPRNVNGGVFLGLNGVVVKSHGGTDAAGFATALRIALELADSRFLTEIEKNLATLGELELQDAAQTAEG